jgi:multidrug resistance efflux pump
LLGAAAVLSLLLAGGVYAWRRHETLVAQPSAASAAPPPEELAAGSEVSFSGPVQARNLLVVPAPIEGVLETIEVEPGGEVEEEQVLGRIKNLSLEAAQEAAREELEQIQNRVNKLESSLIAARLEVSRAMAESDRARGEFERFDKVAQREQMLYREGATARLKFEKAQKEVDTARREHEAARMLTSVAEERVQAAVRDLEAAKRQLDEKQKSLEGASADLQAAEVKSPAVGVLVGARVKAGEEVDPSMKDLFQIAVNPIELKIVVEPDPKVEPRLKDGLPALVQVVEYSGEAIQGELKKSEEGTWRVEFLAPDPMIKPGLTASVRIKLP